MSEGQRPGGLTALAVINFVLSAWNCLVVLVMGIALAMYDKMIEAMEDKAERTSDPNAEASVEMITEMGRSVFLILLLIYGVVAFLLISSGVGYLKQKKVLGRMLGNIYAVLWIIAGGVEGYFAGFQMFTMVGLIYPLLTLAMLNLVFKEDFIN